MGSSVRPSTTGTHARGIRNCTHTHVVVMNRARSEDGVWRTLDSRDMFRATVGLSEMYNGVLSDFLTQALGWGWESTKRQHSQVPKYEVAGIP